MLRNLKAIFMSALIGLCIPSGSHVVADEPKVTVEQSMTTTQALIERLRNPPKVQVPVRKAPAKTVPIDGPFTEAEDEVIQAHIIGLRTLTTDIEKAHEDTVTRAGNLVAKSQQLQARIAAARETTLLIGDLSKLLSDFDQRISTAKRNVSEIERRLAGEGNAVSTEAILMKNRSTLDVISASVDAAAGHASAAQVGLEEAKALLPVGIASGGTQE